ncbi:M48 family metallopeptidase [Candidatus Woesearchaeota archaeon]|nr:M48 family metallopeptidase [Candidatus Woesearchaeota archaeon]
MHYLIKKSYTELFNEEPDFDAKLMYSKAFKGYNAKVVYSRDYKEFRLSHSWKEVSDEIKIGLLQSLMNKIQSTDISTVNIDLYNIFLKKIPALTPKTKTDNILEDSFERINSQYFNGLLLKPNLEWGGKNFRTLGTYDYNTDTIRISRILKKDQMLMDYVMYHEMLHKKFRYKNTGKRTIHHSREFREQEKKFLEPDMEKKLTNFLRKEKIRESFWFN